MSHNRVRLQVEALEDRLAPAKPTFPGPHAGPHAEPTYVVCDLACHEASAAAAVGGVGSSGFLGPTTYEYYDYWAYESYDYDAWCYDNPASCYGGW
jgi:hypothetical protein